MFEEKNYLYINWVDAPIPAMFDWQKQGITNFTIVLDFIEKWLKTKKVFVHCDQGQSRSPALGMLFVAKRMKKISPDFELAKLEFAKIYLEYFSESGIIKFINQNWDNLK